MVVAGGRQASLDDLSLPASPLPLGARDGAVTAVLDDRLSRLPRALLATDAIIDSTVRN